MKYNIKKIKITPKLARLHAHICGDGYMYKGKTRRSKKELKQHPRKNTIRNRFYLRYCNNEQILLNQFIIDIKEVFNRKAVLISKKNEIDVQGKWLYLLFKKLGAGKSKEWFIPSEIMLASNKVKIEWLKAFFDDESYVDKKRKRIVLNIVNKRGLLQIKELLSQFNIDSRLNGPYKYKQYFSYHLTINKNSSQRYFEIIGFNHPKKIFKW